jgi:peptidoglycan/LPS O-acetylase OafA/YrhL
MEGTSRSIVYRPDIDCLRAFAVTAVIFYHYDIPPFRSGFIGVDVFFVVSGFLITNIIQTEHLSGRFSFYDFYKRRARRILPAAFAMITSVLALGSAVLLPLEAVDLAQQSLAAITFSSNTLFWFQQHYFDAAAINKALLHTWSLAVEEQYYILFPVAAIASFSLSRPLMLVSVAAVCAASLVTCVVQTRVDQAGAFYLLPARIWELGIGVLLAVGALPALRDNRLKLATCILGWLFLFISVNAFTGQTPYPGINALLPCTGAALVIWSNPSLSELVMAATKPVTKVGMWSYSLYLWHWPTASFSHAVWGPPVSSGAKMALLGCCGILSVATYYLVERPMRVADWRITWRALSAAAIGLTAASTAVVLCDGFPLRFSPEELKIASYLGYDYRSDYEAQTCFLIGDQRYEDLNPSCVATGTGRNVLLWGDSHAAHLIPGLKQELPLTTLMRTTMAGCLPYDHYGESQACRMFNQHVLELVSKLKPDIVIISANWTTRSIAAPEAKASMLASVKRIISGGSRVVVIGPSPQYANAVPRIYISFEHFGSVSANQVEPFVRETDDFMRDFVSNSDRTEYVSLFDLACGSGACPMLAGITPVAWDQGHFTKAGSVWAASLIVNSSRFLYGVNRPVP